MLGGAIDDQPADVAQLVALIVVAFPATRLLYNQELPRNVEDGTERENPVLEIFQYHVFPRFETVVVERPEQYGGNLTYDDYESLADDLESGDLHPADAKGALADYLDELIAPGRAQIVES